MITLKTLPKATTQEVFDQGALHMLNQGCKSVLAGNCAYRGKEELKCVGGCFLSDSDYKTKMENQTWLFLAGEKLVPDAHKELIAELQSLHDHVDVDQWGSGLISLATSLGLSSKVIEEFKND